MITIVDYGVGNLGSVVNMCKHLGIKVEVEGDPDRLRKAHKILLPGVGAFDAAMNRILDQNLKQVLDEKALQEKIPILGICLGMQLLTKESEEGKVKGFGWVPAVTRSFRNTIDKSYKIPHMGWNLVAKAHDNPLTREFTADEEMRFYFVHAYYVQVLEKRHSILTTTYGIDFDSGIQYENIFGVQFHPEKSHKFGMRLLQGFANL